LDRKIHVGGWISFSLAGQLAATVFGIDEQKTLSRAVEQILASPESAEFNSLESCEWPRRPRNVPGSALCNCLRPITTYPGKRDSSPGQGPSGQGPRTIDCRLNQSISMAMRADDHAVPNLVV
jgi:hypothetical protein